MNLTALITTARSLSNDTDTSNLMRGEVPQNKRDNSNRIFQLKRYPVVSASVYLTTGSTYHAAFSPTYGSVALQTGILTFITAPVGTENPWFVDYYWQWNTDAEYTEFFNQALQDIGSSPNSTSVDYGLQSALVQYALYYAYKERAAKYANSYASGGGSVSHSVDVVVKNFLDLAENAITSAKQLRADYYTRYDAAKQAYAADPNAQGNFLGVDPYTPMR